MNRHLNTTEQAVLTLIEQQGIADQQDILGVLDPELGMYYIAEVLETLYAMGLIREVDLGCFQLHRIPQAA